MFEWILVGLAGFALAVLAAVIVMFKLKVRHISRCFDEAGDDQLEQLFSAIELAGNKPANCYVLAKTRLTSDIVGFQIVVPENIVDFPWSGSVFRLVECDASSTDPVSEWPFCESSNGETQTCADGKIYRPLAAPRKRTKSGKFQNSYAPERIYGSSQDVKDALAEMCPKYPKEFLGFVLMASWHTHEYDGINQARIGGSPAWIQSAAFHNCDVCKKRLVQVLQVPGQMLADRQHSEGTFYMLGCVEHPEERKTVYQTT